MIAVFATFFAAFAGALVIAGYASHIRAWWDRQGYEMLERDLQLARMGMVRGRGSAPTVGRRRDPMDVQMSSMEPSGSFVGRGRPPGALLASMERSVLDTPVSEWIAEAERIEVSRFRAQHGPEDAPPRPAWPVEWCDGCEGWMPPPNVVAHGCPQRHVPNGTEKVRERPRSDFLAVLSERHGIPLSELEAYAERANWFRPPKPPPPPRDAGHKSWV